MERLCFSPIHFRIGRGVGWFFSSPICKSHCTPLHLHTHTKHPISRDREKHADDTRSNQNVAAVLPLGLLCFTKKVESQSISRMRHCGAPVTASFCSSLWKITNVMRQEGWQLCKAAHTYTCPVTLQVQLFPQKINSSVQCKSPTVCIHPVSLI